MSNDKLLAHLEATPLEVTKRELELGQCGPVGSENERYVRSYVADKERMLASEAASRAERREEETLSIARNANKISVSARNWSIVATVLSAIAIAASAAVAIWWQAP